MAAAAGVGPVMVHRLRANHKQWTPANVICLDTETTPESCEQGELHLLRCWAARLDVRRARSAAKLGTVTNWGYTGAELGAQLDQWCDGIGSVWCYAHNLSFDLTAARIVQALEACGWQVTDHAVGSETPWLRMRKRESVITFADSWGWLRAPLEAIGADVGIGKPDLPGWDDSDAAWVARCQADVEILAAAMLTLMDWWDAGGHGCWALTGSSAGWNLMRHMNLPQMPMITGNANEDRIGLASAVYGGYRYAFTHGAQQPGRYELWDFRSAYSELAHLPLPTAPAGTFACLPTDTPWLTSDRYGIIAEVDLQAAQPRYPVRAGGRVVYPVGRIRTVLASPEIAAARARGELVSIGKGVLHRLAPWLAPWAAWAAAAIDDDTGAVPEVAKRAIKHWGRAVVGKFGAHGWKKLPAGPATHPGWWYEQTWNAETGKPGHIVEIGGKAWEVIQTPLGENAYPAVLAFVESWCRAYLWRVIDAVGVTNVISADTDGIITAGGSRAAAAIAWTDTGPLVMRRKAVYRTVTVHGPQHITGPGLRKLSGIPRSAQAQPDGTLTATLWPKLGWQMGAGHAEGYLRPVQAYRLARSYITGWVLAGGQVEPLSAALCPAGGVHLLPWTPRGPDADGTELAGEQAPGLHTLITPIPQGGTECTFHSCKPNGTADASILSDPTRCSTSDPPPTAPKGTKARRWPTRGRPTATPARRGSSGWTLTSWLTSATRRACTRISRPIRRRSG